MCAIGCYPNLQDTCYQACDSCRPSNCKCKVCGEGMFFKGCNCYPCPQGCETCESYGENSCTSCLDDFFKSRKSETFNCLSNHCRSSDCPQGKYFDLVECECKNCDFTCSECQGPSNYECTQCSPSSFDASQDYGIQHCQCSSDCDSTMIGNNNCDDACNSEDCNFDGGDCDDTSTGESDDSITEGLSDNEFIAIVTVAGGVVFM
mmetsp:Transcript_19156/g.34970  ORF Transcript_19156/g.34970 Transcript_19156/m.34970 type:complete len:205 (-) Transcript_19156:260-874(-)